MATTLASDFKIYHEEFYGGMFESLAQNLSVFNEASGGTLVLQSETLKGDYQKESFIKALSGFVARRDTTSISAATAIKLVMGEHVSVKCNRKIGPVDSALDPWRKVAKDQREMSFLLGQMIGQHKIQDMANTAIAALAAALANVSGVTFDYSATGTPTHSTLAKGLAKFGDQQARVKAWVMHSKTYFDLVQQSISDKITNVADVTIVQGSIATLGRPVILTDAPALYTAGTPDKYSILGLTENAAVVKETESQDIVSEIVTGLENLVFRVQGEYAFNLGLKGFTWDVTNGGANPASAALATGTNWDQVATDAKDLAGIYILAQ